MEYTIRHIHKKDREAVEKICIATWPAQAEASEDMRKLLLTVFCHYYIEQEPEHCFVAVNDQDEAVGYVLCAHDFEKWKGCFEKEYLKKQENPMIAMVGRGTIDDLAPYAGEYPAHLHIDLLPECQRIGLGTRLMDALTEELKHAGISGVMLGVVADNEKGLNFYRRYGFSELERKEHEIVMGYAL